MAKKVAKVVNMHDRKPHAGNIQDWEEIPGIMKLRIMVHHRLRECVARKITYRSLAKKSHLTVQTISRCSMQIGNRTQLRTIYSLAPWLGIKLTSELDPNW